MSHRPTFDPRPLRASVVAAAAACLLAGAVAAQSPSPEPSGGTGSGIGSPAVVASPAATAVPFAVGPEGTWSVSGFDAAGDGLVEALDGSRLTVSFLPAGRLEGVTPCGTYLGGYTVDGEAMSLGIIALGPGRCGPRREEEAIQLTEALAMAARWRAVTGGLELLDEEGRVRVALAALGGGSLTGEWRVLRHADARGRLRTTSAEPAPTLSFGEAWLLTGRTGCRSFSGSYEMEGDRLLIAPVEVVGRPCEGGAGRREIQLLEALDGAVTWQRDGERLTLRAASGDPLVLAEALSASSPAPSPSASASPLTAPSSEPARTSTPAAGSPRPADGPGL